MSRPVSVAPLLVGEVGDDHPDRHAEEAVDLAHPVGVAAGEIIVDGDDVDALALERVQIDRERRDQRLALAGLHLGDLAAVERDSSDQLDVVVALAERPDRRFAHRRKGFGEEIVEPGAVGQAPAEELGLGAQFVVGQSRNRRLESIDRIDIFAQAADIAVVSRTEDAFGHCLEHGNPSKPGCLRGGEGLSPTLGNCARRCKERPVASQLNDERRAGPNPVSACPSTESKKVL